MPVLSGPFTLLGWLQVCLDSVQCILQFCPWFPKQQLPQNQQEHRREHATQGATNGDIEENAYQRMAGEHYA